MQTRTTQARRGGVRAAVERLESRAMLAGVGAAAVDARPDLSGWVASVSAGPVLAGGTVGAAIGVKNIETAGAASPPASVGLYLSLDNTLDPSDRLIATAPVRPLKVGRQALVRLNCVPLPDDLALGTYQFVARVDEGGVADEQSEENNVFTTFFRVTVVARTVDIVPVAITRIRLRPARPDGFFGDATLVIWNTGNTDYSGEVSVGGYATDDGVPGGFGDAVLAISGRVVNVRAGRSARVAVKFSASFVAPRDFVMFATAARPGDPTPDQHVTAFARFRTR